MHEGHPAGPSPISSWRRVPGPVLLGDAWFQVSEGFGDAAGDAGTSGAHGARRMPPAELPRRSLPAWAPRALYK